MSKFQGVLKMFMLGVLKTISKTVLKYKKNTITLDGTCWNWVADFVFLLRLCTRKRSETYVNGDYKSVFGIGMVLSVERCIVFAICFPVNYYSEPTHRRLSMTFWLVFGLSLELFTFSVSNIEAYKKLSFL